MHVLHPLSLDLYDAFQEEAKVKRKAKARAPSTKNGVVFKFVNNGLLWLFGGRPGLWSTSDTCHGEEIISLSRIELTLWPISSIRHVANMSNFPFFFFFWYDLIWSMPFSVPISVSISWVKLKEGRQKVWNDSAQNPYRWIISLRWL